MGLTFHGDFPAAGQVGFVADQDDGHVVSLVRAPQLNAELRRALKAAPVCDGIDDDVGTAHLQALFLLPAFFLQERGPRSMLRQRLGLDWSNGLGWEAGFAKSSNVSLGKFPVSPGLSETSD